MTKEPPQTRKWVSDKFLSDYYQVSRVTIWRWAKIGKLPAPEIVPTILQPSLISVAAPEALSRRRRKRFSFIGSIPSGSRRQRAVYIHVATLVSASFVVSASQRFDRREQTTLEHESTHEFARAEIVNVFADHDLGRVQDVPW